MHAPPWAAMTSNEVWPSQTCFQHYPCATLTSKIVRGPNSRQTKAPRQAKPRQTAQTDSSAQDSSDRQLRQTARTDSSDRQLRSRHLRQTAQAGGQPRQLHPRQSSDSSTQDSSDRQLRQSSSEGLSWVLGLTRAGLTHGL